MSRRIAIVAANEYCTNGWGPGGCTYTGGHYCVRKAGHPGRCTCDCGATTTKKPLTAEQEAAGQLPIRPLQRVQ